MECNLAKEIDNLMKSHDPYEYVDQIDSNIDPIEEVLLLLKTDVMAIVNALTEIYPYAVDEDKATIRHILNQL